MKNNYIKFIAGAALASILLLQGMWLYNMYRFLENEFKEDVNTLLILSLDKEAILRLDDPAKKGTWKQKVISGVNVENDHYTNNRYLQDYLYREDYPLSLEKTDSIFSAQSREKYKDLNYSLSITDSTGCQQALINHGQEQFGGRLDYKETIQLRNIAPEYIHLTVFSPYKTIFGKMFLILIGSLILAVIVIYVLSSQTRTIDRQKRIAEIRRDFTHAMVHDIKNPLTSILMGVSNIKSRKVDDQPALKEQYFKIIANEGKHILSIINKILTIAQFEGSKVPLSKQPIDLSGLIHSLMESYLLNPSKEIRFHTEFNDVQNIYADYGYIYESFANIIDNAVKYSKEQVHIDITCLKKNEYVEIRFKDNGIGIPDRDRKRIFEKFERTSLATKKTETSGFGLGLNYVYQVITAHGGEIKVESVLGKYSEFIIYLPDNDQTVIG